MSDIKKLLVAQETFTSLRFLQITAWIEFESFSNTIVPKDVIYINFANNKGDTQNTSYDMGQ